MAMVALHENKSESSANMEDYTADETPVLEIHYNLLVLA